MIEVQKSISRVADRDDRVDSEAFLRYVGFALFLPTVFAGGVTLFHGEAAIAFSVVYLSREDALPALADKAQSHLYFFTGSGPFQQPLAVSCCGGETMLAVRCAPQRCIWKSACSRRDHSRALTTSQRATGSAETLCTLHVPLLNTGGLVADCDGYAVTCCVEEESKGWVVKRSKTGTGFATLFRLDFKPTALAVASGDSILVAAPVLRHVSDLEGPNERLDYKPSADAKDSKGTIVVAGNGHIHTFNCEGSLQHTLAVPGRGSVACMACLKDGRLIFIADDTMYMANLRVAIMCEDDVKELVSHVKPSGGLALFPAAKKVLFISDRNSLCEVDIDIKESRVITERMSTAGRLCSGTEKSALFIYPASSDSMYLLPCSMSGSMSTSMYHTPRQSALSADFCVNSCGDVLFFEPSTYSLTNLRKLPGVLPT